MFQTAELSIGLIIAIIWMAVSFFASANQKRKKNLSGGNHSPRKPSGLSDIFGDLTRKIDEIKLEIEKPVKDLEFMFSDKAESSEGTEDIPVYENAYVSEEAIPNYSWDDNELEVPVITVDEHYVNEFARPRVYKLVGDLHRSSFLKRGIVLKEILDKPRAYRPIF